MKPDVKAATMDAFTHGEIQVLVATTVIEVGVDVPNASIMVIEHAERFGLAQLHQLRGRVGRGAAESTCVLLFEDPLTDTAKQRLKVIYEENDGFEIARQDLLIRGPGEFLGALRAAAPVIAVDDAADRPLPVDVVVNGSIAAESLPYRRASGAEFLLGSRYALLDPVFSEMAERPVVNEELCGHGSVLPGSEDRDVGATLVVAVLASAVRKRGDHKGRPHRR